MRPVVSEKFGDIFKRLRIASGQTLRAFCLKHGFDPGNVSRIERGRSAPPESSEVLEKYAKALKIEKSSADWQLFFDSAAAECGRVPADLLEDDELVEKLPVLFRAIRGTNPHGDGLDELIEKIRRG
jgi:transcriptional regulator with XRE-family HTH domain